MIFFSCQKSLNNEKLLIDPEEFLNYSIDGVDYAYAASNDTIGIHNFVPSESSIFSLWLRVYSRGQSDGNYSVLFFAREGIAVNSNQSLHLFGTTAVFGANNALLSQNPLFVHITEYGQIGEFIAGNFQGILFETQGSNQNHNVACSFRVRRTF